MGEKRDQLFMKEREREGGGQLERIVFQQIQQMFHSTETHQKYYTEKFRKLFHFGGVGRRGFVYK